MEAAGLSPTDVDEILRSHLIDPESLRSDDFETFLAVRREALIRLVDSKLRNKVQRSDQEPDVGVAALFPADLLEDA